MTRCARCHRPIKATSITIGGYAYGPKCSVIMGIATKPVKTSPQANQKHGLIHRATHRIKTAGMAFYRKWRNAVMPWQIEMFDEVQK